MLNAALWHNSAAERRALVIQTYRLAEARLAEGLASPRWTAALEQTGDPSALPPAVIMDLDETVLDNARYEAAIVLELGEFRPEDFARWCEREPASAVPGAVPFIRTARERGVKVFFYSARWEGLRPCTVRALEAVGAGPVATGELFLRPEGGKSAVRERLSRRYRIVLLVGDNLEDFVAGSKDDAAARRDLVEHHRDRFGRTWIVLPNAVYGHWEALFYDFDYTVPRYEKLLRKREALR